MCGQQSLYEQFGTYLVQNGLYMGSQYSSDSFAGALGNQTNLAVKVRLSLDEQLGCPFSLRSLSHLFKSIIALKAASEIFRILGDDEKTQQFGVRRLVLIYYRKVVKVCGAERCYLVPGAMAGCRALVGQVSLHPFVWEQPIVSVTGTNPVIFAVLM